MATKKYEPGDIVQLKSGSPKMTVKTLYADGDVQTQWFAGAKLETGRFDPQSVQHYVEPPKSKDL
jgi:uncharacterized protein YodC (DUF2158 family)